MSFKTKKNLLIITCYISVIRFTDQNTSIIDKRYFISTFFFFLIVTNVLILTISFFLLISNLKKYSYTPKDNKKRNGFLRRFTSILFYLNLF